VTLFFTVVLFRFVFENDDFLLFAVMSLTTVEPIIKQAGKDGGFLEVHFPETDSDDKVQLLLEGMLVSLQTIERDYGRYMKIILS